MIPKIIHYCWFGGKPLPPLAKKCLDSWKRFCPDYEIIQWNESNFDLSSTPLYVKQAYEAKKWAFVTDYVRLQVVYENGGIYFDTDVELLKPLEPFLSYRAFFGFENRENINTGLGFGAEKGTPLLKALMDDYRDALFCLEDNTFDTTPCPERNSTVYRAFGLVSNGSNQALDGDIGIFSTEYFCPIDFFTKQMHKTENTVTIHWFSGSWIDKRAVRRQKIRVKLLQTLKKIIGSNNYEKLKARYKH